MFKLCKRIVKLNYIKFALRESINDFDQIDDLNDIYFMKIEWFKGEENSKSIVLFNLAPIAKLVAIPYSCESIDEVQESN